MRAKVAIDRAASRLRFALSATPSAEQWQRIVREIEEAQGYWNDHGWITGPSRYHDRPPKLHSPILHRTRSRGVDLEHLSFESGYEPHPDEPGRDRWLNYEVNRTAHAWVFQHPGRPRPWLMCIHGYGFGMPILDLEAFRVSWLYNELGLNVVLPVLPLHGPRKIGWQSGDGFLGGDILDTIHAEAQSTWDLRRILSWVRAQAAPAVGVYGLSLGGYNAALLSAFDANLSCVIAGIPAADFVRLARLHSRPSVLTLAEQSGLNWDAVSRLAQVISPLTFASRVARKRRFILGGLADNIVPPDQVRDLWEHWGRPRIEWYEGSHLSLPWETVVRSFLRDALGATLTQRNDDARIDRAVA